MLHEIIKTENDFQNEENTDQNQRLVVVKITRCKMRAKDILELEIGIKNIAMRNIDFEDRKFILRFLNKLYPNLACKGKINLSGKELLQLQKMQNQISDSSFSNSETPSSSATNSPLITHGITR